MSEDELTQQVANVCDVLAVVGISASEAARALTDPEFVEAMNRAWVYGKAMALVHVPEERVIELRRILGDGDIISPE